MQPSSAPIPRLQTDLHAHLTQTHSKISLLLAARRLPELAAILESLQQRMKDYYKLTPSISKNMEAIRDLNKLRKREEIALLHNQAVLCLLQRQPERAIDLRTIILEELGNMVQGEQTRYGFLEESDQKQRKTALESIAFWRMQMVRHYYFLATDTYHHSAPEMSLAALMKGFDLIKQSYLRELQAARNRLDKVEEKSGQEQSFSSRLCHFEQVEELFLFWQLRERVGHSKYLNIVSSNTLTEMLSCLAKDRREKEASPAEFGLFEAEKMAEMELPKLEEVMEGRYQGNPAINQLQANKIAHYLYLELLAKIYCCQDRQTESEYQKLKNAKNVVFLHLLQALIAHHYLPNCQQTEEALQEYQKLYKPKIAVHKQNPNIYALIELFGLTPEGLSEHSNQTNEEVSIINLVQKPKKNMKKVKSNSKAKSNSQPQSKPKEKPLPSKAGKKPNQQKQKKQRVKEEYMLKRDAKRNVKVGEDYLLKAINQNYRSFDSSRSKDKHNSPFRRAIRTETCINDHKAKQETLPSKAQRAQRQRKLH